MDYDELEDEDDVDYGIDLPGHDDQVGYDYAEEYNEEQYVSGGGCIEREESSDTDDWENNFDGHYQQQSLRSHPSS